MAESLVLVERPAAGCALVTLNRPQAMNALSLGLRRQLVATFDALAADHAIRVVVLTGAGRAFCAGLDLKELGAASDARAALLPDESVDPVRALERFGGPVIAAVNGPAITGGFELALACDLIIASRHAAFADTHARLGVLPGWGLSQRLPRRIGVARAKELAFTGNFIDAEQAERWGLVNRVVDHADLLPHALALAGDMLSTVPPTLTAYKRLIDDGLALALGDALVEEARRYAQWASAIDAGEIERRREAVTERGRAGQTAGGA